MTSEAKPETREVGNSRLTVLRGDLGRHSRDEAGRELWWFGSEPPGGVPAPGNFVDAARRGALRQFAPPWAAVAYDPAARSAWLCTDALGLRHLYVRQAQGTLIASPCALAAASADDVHLDAIGAYELMARGNPQGGRTLFKEVSSLAPATVWQQADEAKQQTYWSPSAAEPVDEPAAVEQFTCALARAAARHWRAGDTQELTAGRDSLLLLAALTRQQIPVQTWTMGLRDDPDMAGAQARARALGVPHQAVFLEPLLEAGPEEAFALARAFLNATGGMADALTYGVLPWVLERVQGAGSISGGGGETFRGFYYEWAGKGRLSSRAGFALCRHGARGGGGQEADRVVRGVAGTGLHRDPMARAS